MPRRSRPAKRAPLSRDRIVAAAVRLADSGGTDILSMRALAASLGVKAMSLYNHIRDKDDLLDALVESVVREIDPPTPGTDWRDQMRKRAGAMREAFLAHPWAPTLIVGRLNTGPAMLALIDASLGCLHEAGFSYVQADHALEALDSFILGFHLQERSFPLRPEDYATAARTLLPGIDATRYPHFAALGRLVADGRYDGVNHMAYGLDLLLDALEAERSR